MPCTLLCIASKLWCHFTQERKNTGISLLCVTHGSARWKGHPRAPEHSDGLPNQGWATHPHGTAIPQGLCAHRRWACMTCWGPCCQVPAQSCLANCHQSNSYFPAGVTPGILQLSELHSSSHSSVNTLVCQYFRARKTGCPKSAHLMDPDAFKIYKK